ncbi:MAG: SOS response-associated peptidase [Chloroflexota bacterium]
MCGRFVLNADSKAIQQAFDLTNLPDKLMPRFNIAPTQPVGVITNHDPRSLQYFRWGLVPFWAKDSDIGSRMINARSETLQDKPSFKHAYRKRRCLIPATGFYEWKQTDDGKQPYFIHLKEQPVFAFAGLWESWDNPEGETLRTFTIITSDPNDLVKPLHNRMPVILRRDDYDMWLSPDDLPPDALTPLLRPYDADSMDAYPVSTQVNSPRNDAPDLIEPLDNTPPSQPSLL